MDDREITERLDFIERIAIENHAMLSRLLGRMPTEATSDDDVASALAFVALDDLNLASIARRLGIHRTAMYEPRFAIVRKRIEKIKEEKGLK